MFNMQTFGWFMLYWWIACASASAVWIFAGVETRKPNMRWPARLAVGGLVYYVRAVGAGGHALRVAANGRCHHEQGQPLRLTVSQSVLSRAPPALFFTS